MKDRSEINFNNALPYFAFFKTFNEFFERFLSKIFFLKFVEKPCEITGQTKC